ncbi:MAG: TatD family hydrolase [Cytophagaceae bacterium]|jgi:TatD DNase family protein|nr:TatD family hydrolase [Cytophagaceae bacterium]
MIIDTHIHLYAEEYGTERRNVIERAIEQGVGRFYIPNVEVDSIDGVWEVVQQFPEHVVPMMGLHPCYVKEDYHQQLTRIEKEVDRPEVAAIGEIGLDLYWDKTYIDIQKEALQIQCRWALERDLPVIIHSREAFHETFELLEPFMVKGLRGVFHCFGGSIKEASMLWNYGFYVGIGGVSTFKKAGMDQVLPYLPMEQIVLETDGPYLAPVPYRGKRNDPEYLTIIAARVAELRGITYEEVALATSQNANQLFR